MKKGTYMREHAKANQTLLVQFLRAWMVSIPDQTKHIVRGVGTALDPFPGWCVRTPEDAQIAANRDLERAQRAVVEAVESFHSVKLKWTAMAPSSVRGPHKFEIYKDKSGEFRVRFKQGSEIVQQDSSVGNIKDVPGAGQVVRAGKRLGAD
jgi:hypothetical protein